MDIERRDEFKKLIYGFFRDHDDVDVKDMTELLRSAFEFYASEHGSYTEHRQKMNEMISAESRDDFKTMWEEFVQKTIDYVNDHEDVKTTIETERKNVSDEWNKNVKEGSFRMEPDLRFLFSIDGLDESLEHKKWAPATDSAIILRVGNKDIIEMM